MAVTHGSPPHDQRPAVNRRGLPLQLLEIESNASRAPPPIQHLRVAEAVLPRHQRRLDLAGGQRIRHGIHLQRVERSGAAGDGFALAVAQQIERPAAVRTRPEPRHVDANRAACTVDPHGIVQRQRHGRRNASDETARKAQQRRRPAVYAGLGQRGEAGHVVRFLAGDEPRHGNRIAAHVHDAAPSQFVAVEAGFRVERRGETEIGIDLPHLRRWRRRQSAAAPWRFADAPRYMKASIRKRWWKSAVSTIAITSG